MTDRPAREFLDLWVDYAREFVGESTALRRPVLPVSYNAWVQSESYRTALASALGLATADRGVHEVPNVFGGSSFDGRSFDGNAAKMDVFGRWRTLVGDPVFRTMAADPALRRLAEQLFPDLTREVLEAIGDHAATPL